MKTADRQKMCPNCDGRVSYEVTQRPYCFATLQNVPEGQQGSLFSLQDSLYSPPFRPAPPIEEKKSSPKIEQEAPKEKIEETKEFWTILLLTLGGNLFALGILQFFFADEGLVQLEISASYWFVFVLLSLPLFYVGFRKAAYLK